MFADTRIINKLTGIQKRYELFCFEHVADIQTVMCQTTMLYRTPPASDPELTWRPIHIGDSWGGDGITAWFLGSTTLPKSCDGKKVFVRAQTGAVETLFFADNEPKGAFNLVRADPHPQASRTPWHHTLMLADCGRAGQTYDLAFEAYAGHAHPESHPDSAYVPMADSCCTYSGTSLMVERPDVIGFVYDLKVLLQVLNCLDRNSLRRAKLVAGLKDVFTLVPALPHENPQAAWIGPLKEARQRMQPLLTAHNGSTVPFIGLTGHSHLDTAWKWTIDETTRKCARTFSTALSLLEQYPRFRFVQSVAWYDEVVRQEYPAIFEKIRQMVKQGRWEPNGAVWVEPDCNIPSGESLVRQILIGLHSRRKLYGYKADTMWLPDVFGYSAAMPQILRACGIEFFCTTKLTWNDTTCFPYGAFWWKGIDGSSVLTHFNQIHFPPDPENLHRIWNSVQQKDVQDRCLHAFGHGDGGGGPRFEDIEVTLRVGDLEGCPRTGYTSVSDFMKTIRDTATDLPQWSGELYLELHRGTLTSIAALKRLNRKAEIALRDAELLCTHARVQGRPYPSEKLLDLWKKLLVNQFHDILPGTSIGPVNDRAIGELTQCNDAARATARDALALLTATNGKNQSRLLLANTLTWDRGGEISIDGIDRDLAPIDDHISSQRVTDVFGDEKLLISGPVIPSTGSVVINLREQRPKGKSPFAFTDAGIETPHAVIRFAEAGSIRSFYCKRARRDIARKNGVLNAFWFGEDVPEFWDNWDIDHDQQLKMNLVDALVARELVADGPLQCRYRSTYALSDESTLVQDMVLHAYSPRVDFETVVDWHEKHKLLKVGFELDLVADYARHEIQFGHVKRPTHRNQAQDRARFEVCAHKWTDISENDFGVALLNDCKYGVGVNGSTVTLSLIKSGTHPDDRGDEGRHVFTYSLLPHVGGFSVGSVVRPAYELNFPAIASTVSDGTEAYRGLVSISSENVILEAAKWAENGMGFVLRLYEAGGTGAHTEVRFQTDVRSISATNLLEEDRREITLKDNVANLYFRPFEIKTLYCQV